MNFFKAYEIDFYTKRISGILTIFPYQFAFGISIRLWPCVTTICFRLYFCFFKLALNLNLKWKNKNGKDMS